MYAVSGSRSIVSIKTVAFSAVVEGLRRFSDWAYGLIPPVACWEIFGWSETEDIPGILSVLDIEIQNGLFDGYKLLAGVTTGSTLISTKNKRTFRGRLPDIYQLCSFPKLSGVNTLVQKQAAYAYYCPIHEKNTEECRPFRFYEIYFLYLLWHQSHIFDPVQQGKVKSAAAGEKIQLDLRNLIVSKVLPFFKADLSRLLDSVNSSVSFLATWLSSPAVRQGATLARLVGAASPCISKYYCIRIDSDFTLENEAKLETLARVVLSDEDLAVLQVAAKGLPLTRIPRAAQLAREVSLSRIPFLKKGYKKHKNKRETEKVSPKHWEQSVHVEIPKIQVKKIIEESIEPDTVELFSMKPQLVRAVDGEDYGCHWRRMLKVKSTIGSSMRYITHNQAPRLNWYLSSIQLHETSQL